MPQRDCWHLLPLWVSSSVALCFHLPLCVLYIWNEENNENPLRGHPHSYKQNKKIGNGWKSFFRIFPPNIQIFCCCKFRFKDLDFLGRMIDKIRVMEIRLIKCYCALFSVNPAINGYKSILTDRYPGPPLWVWRRVLASHCIDRRILLVPKRNSGDRWFSGRTHRCKCRDWELGVAHTGERNVENETG